MAKKEEQDSLRTRLIRAGIEEIGAHGIADFSLRRVAAACGVSCAAPYRHFADREEFIRATVAYINSQWGLLRENITRLYQGDKPRCLTELCVAYVRFLVANDNYRSVLLASGETWEGDERFFAPLQECLCEGGADEEEQARRQYAIRAIVYGTVAMLASGELKNEDASFGMIRKTVLKEITSAGCN